MKMRVLDHEALLGLNQSSVQAGRNQNLPSATLSAQPQERYWISCHNVLERNGSPEIRLCVVLDLFAGKTAWLDVSSDEFAAIQEIDVSDAEWETAMCAGTPPQAP